MHKAPCFTSELQVKLNMWINDAEKVRQIVSALSDEYSRKIISATISAAKSPEQISGEQGIPVSTCYRRIHDLLILSIIHVNRIDLANGKKSVLYKSAYKNILIKFEANKLSVELVSNTNSPAENLSEMWKSVQSEANNVSAVASLVVRDCDLCQSKDTVCKIFVTGDSKSYLSVCEKCSKKMQERNTIKAVENTTHERLTQNIMSKIK